MPSTEVNALVERVEVFVRETVIPDERDPRCGEHGPSDALVDEMRAATRAAGRIIGHVGGTGVSRDTIVEQVFREVRAFRIYDGPTEVHKWSLAKKVKRDWSAATK